MNNIVPLIAKSECMINTIKNLKSLKSARIFSLIGNGGCGKKFLANHFISLWGKTTSLIDCQNPKLNLNDLENLAKNNEEYTFIVDHPEKLDNEQQIRLSNIMHATIGSNLKQWINIIDIKDKSSINKALYERVALFPIAIPNLQDRKKDLPYIAKIMQKNIGKLLNKKLYKLNMEHILAHNWETNFHELKRYIEQMFFTSNFKNMPYEEEEIILDDVFFTMNLKDATKLFESIYIKKQLKNKSYKLAARNCDVNRTTLYRKLRNINKLA